MHDVPPVTMLAYASKFTKSLEALLGMIFHVPTPRRVRLRGFCIFAVSLIRHFGFGDPSKRIRIDLQCFVINLCFSVSATQIYLIV